FAGLERAAVEQLPDRAGDGRRVDDCAVHDAVGRQRLAPERGHAVALAVGLELDGLDGTRADVEADDGFGLSAREHAGPFPQTRYHTGAGEFAGKSPGAAQNPRRRVQRPIAENYSSVPRSHKSVTPAYAMHGRIG